MSLPRSSVYRLLPTEQPNPRSRGLDLKSSLQVVRTINAEDARVAAAVGREAATIARAVDLLHSTLRQGGRLLLIGAGTSGRLAVLEAAECPPTFGTPPSLVQAIIAGGRSSVFRAKEGAEDSFQQGFRAVNTRCRPRDIVIGIAASGVTPFVRGGLAAARARSCETILVTSNHKPSMPEARIVICPKVGPEVLAGSTRMKAGTAAKLVLNTLTTAAMIRWGKVYDRWMVDLKPNSRKLKLRAIRMVAELAAVSPKRAQALLRASKGSVKAAVVAASLEKRRRNGKVSARSLLTLSGGSLRRALALAKAGR